MWMRRCVERHACRGLAFFHTLQASKAEDGKPVAVKALSLRWVESDLELSYK
jgi:hypothetical protein